MHTNYFIHYLFLIHCANERIIGKEVDILVRQLQRKDIL